MDLLPRSRMLSVFFLFLAVFHFPFHLYPVLLPSPHVVFHFFCLNCIHWYVSCFTEGIIFASPYFIVLCLVIFFSRKALSWSTLFISVYCMTALQLPTTCTFKPYIYFHESVHCSALCRTHPALHPSDSALLPSIPFSANLACGSWLATNVKRG